MSLRVPLGLDIYGRISYFDLAEAPHTLIAGRSGSGKSMLLHSILCNLLLRNSPDTLALVLADPKMTEMSLWEGLPHLYGRVMVDVDRIIDGLWWCVEEMEARYRTIVDAGARDISSYNALPGITPIPHCLIVVDEIADLMMQGRGEVESAVVRLGQKGRAAGICMVLATQSPRANVITGLLKANLTARIALATSSALDSRVIFDRSGAENLLGRGDMYLDDGVSGELQRLQAPNVTVDDISMLVDHWSGQTAREAVAA